MTKVTDIIDIHLKSILVNDKTFLKKEILDILRN